MNSRLDRLEGVAEFLRPAVVRLFGLCEEKLKTKLLLVHGFRSSHEQMLLYQKGRNYNREEGIWVVVNKGDVVTNALPGKSAHNVVRKLDGRAAAVGVDVVPFTKDGGVNWAPPDAFWDDLYELSWKVGLDPLGDPVGAFVQWDKGHFEEPGWKLKLDGLGLILPVADVHGLSAV